MPKRKRFRSSSFANLGQKRTLTLEMSCDGTAGNPIDIAICEDDMDESSSDLAGGLHLGDKAILTVSLHMECEEEELSPAQVSAYAQAKLLYEKSQAQIAEARRKGLVISESVRRAASVLIDDDETDSRSSGRSKRASAKTLSLLNATTKKSTAQPRALARKQTPKKPINIAPQPGLTISDVRGSVDMNNFQNLHPTLANQLMPPEPPMDTLILAHQVGTNQRVLIPLEKFRQMPPGQFNFIKTVNTKPSTFHSKPAPSQPSPVSAPPARKRSIEISPQVPGTKKPRDMPVNFSEGKWIPLDEYYYCRRGGDPTYREDKGQFKFQCWYCHQVLYNNIRLITHMQGHIDNEKQLNLDMTDLTVCKYCYKLFDAPYELQAHVAKVHQGSSNVLVCRICERDQPSQSTLQSHMKTAHVACEMPYVCQLCNFRSSIYSDVIEHFKKRHDSSENLMCYYCLKVFKIQFTASGKGFTQDFYKHLQLHQVKIRTKKCTQCKLTFIQAQEAKAHKRTDHMVNFKGIDIAAAGDRSRGRTVNRNLALVMMQVADPLTTNTHVKMANNPAVAKVQEMRGIRFSRIPENHVCLECNTNMDSYDHYKKQFECLVCLFATTCYQSYSNHLRSYHAGHIALRKDIARPEKKLKAPLYCLCGFQCSFGNTMARHLVSCGKMTTHFKKTEPKFIEYDDEQEDFNASGPEELERSQPDSNVPTMFAALGLVKRPVETSHGSSTAIEDVSNQKEKDVSTKAEPQSIADTSGDTKIAEPSEIKDQTLINEMQADAAAPVSGNVKDAVAAVSENVKKDAIVSMSEDADAQEVSGVQPSEKSSEKDLSQDSDESKSDKEAVQENNMVTNPITDHLDSGDTEGSEMPDSSSDAPSDVERKSSDVPEKGTDSMENVSVSGDILASEDLPKAGDVSATENKTTESDAFVPNPEVAGNE